MKQCAPMKFALSCKILFCQ